MSDLNKAWVASEGLKRADRIVAQLAEDGAANNNIIGPVLQHRMRETIGREIDMALQQHPPTTNGATPVVTREVTLSREEADGARETAQREGISDEEAYTDAALEKLGRAPIHSKRAKRGGKGRGRKQAAGADA